jgi:hypothetical protein
MNKLIIVFLLVFSASARSAVDCSNKYRIAESTDIRICSHQPILPADLRFIRHVVEVSEVEYYRFLESKFIYTDKVDIDRIDIAVMPYKSLNDGTLPHGKSEGVVGRYYPGKNRVYVESLSIQLRQSVLAHEIAHLINYHIGINDLELDEKLAYEFEEYLDNR